jgi:hypothetical protein
MQLTKTKGTKYTKNKPFGSLFVYFVPFVVKSGCTRLS